MMDKQTKKRYTPTQTLFLGRLERLLLTVDQLAAPSHVLWPNKLVSMATYSTLVDCRDLGLESEARSILATRTAESREKSW